MAQAELEVVAPGSPRARAVRRAFVDHVLGVLGEPPVGLADPLDDGDPHLDADLAPPDGVFWLAVVSGADVGCAGGRDLGGGTVEVKRMYVAPQARGAGLGRSLLGRVEAWAAERGARRVVLDTHSDLVAAGRLYRATGYREVAPYNDNPHADLWFAKDLPGCSQ